MHRTTCPHRFAAVIAATLLAASSGLAATPGTGFTYQGVLEDGGAPVTTAVDVRFTLYSDAGGASQVGSPISVASITPLDGVLSTALDFGLSSLTDNQARWLRLEVSPAGAGAYDDLGLQSLDAAPFALNTRGIAVDENGNVGIGTTAPLADLHIAPTSGSANMFMLGAGQPSGISFGVGSNGLAIGTQDADGTNFQYLGRWDASGNLGVGTSTPTSPLTVNGTIETTSGGVKFPDGSTQPNAAVGYRIANEHLMLGPGSFVGATVFNQLFFGMYASGSEQILAPVYLPVGAEIVSMTAYVNDTVTENLRVSICKKVNGAPSCAGITLDFEVVGNSGYFSHTENSGHIVNDSQAYFVIVEPITGVGSSTWQGTSLALQNIDIEWRMP